MTSRMEKVAEHVALAVFRKVCTLAEPPLQPQQLLERLRAMWPEEGSRLPMNDAMSSAVAAATQSAEVTDRETWQTRVATAWPQAVTDVVEQYFRASGHSFRNGKPMDGVETLTDTVRVTLGHIAAIRQWPHSTQEDLYSIAAALGSGNGWPEEMEEFEQALEDASPDGQHLGAALGACMGRPDVLKSGLYEGDPDGPERDGMLFARTAIELANRLASLETLKH